MYRRNASAFEHDVRRFMTRNGCPIRRTPVWQCMPITLYQLFLAVYDRNGYYQVSTYQNQRKKGLHSKTN